MPPARSSAQYLKMGGPFGSSEVVGRAVVVYGARDGRRSQSVAVSWVRNDMPA